MATAATLLASSSSCVKIWNSKTHSLVREYSPHASKVSSISWNHNNQVIASSGYDGKIVLSHVSGKLLGTLPLVTGKRSNLKPLTSLCFSSGSRYICSGNVDGIVNLWDLRVKEMIHNMKGHTNEVTSLDIGGKDLYVVSSSLSSTKEEKEKEKEPGKLIVFNLESGRSFCSYQFPSKSSILCARFSHHPSHQDAGLLAAVSSKGEVMVWNSLKTKQNLPSSLVVHYSSATGVCFSPTNQLLMGSCGLDKKIVLFDINSFQKLSVIPSEYPLTSLALHPDGFTLASGTQNGYILWYDLRSPSSKPIQSTEAYSNLPITTLAYQKRSYSSSSSSSSTKFIKPSSKPHKLEKVQNLEKVDEDEDQKINNLEIKHNPVINIESNVKSLEKNIVDVSDNVDNVAWEKERSKVKSEEDNIMGALDCLKPFIKNLFQEYQQNSHEDVVNLQLDMIRQFFIQQGEISKLLEQNYLNHDLKKEIQELKKEIQDLKLEVRNSSFVFH